MFADNLEHISSGMDSINDEAEVLSVEVDYKPSAELEKELISTGSKGCRFQMILLEER